ncbi:MAG: sugar ABC transporter permease [Anaerolineae bacterium]|jgi:multiple sugar transport system permease protein
MTAITPAQPSAKPDGRKRNRKGRSEALWGLAFLSPWFIGLAAFILLPMLATLALSFTNFNLVQEQELRFVGLANYAKLIRDAQAHTAMLVTLKFGAIMLPIAIGLPIALAALLNSESLLGKAVFRTLFYMPFIVPMVSAVYVWSGMLNTQSGWINRALEAMGLTGPDWMNSTTWIYPALVVINLWGIGQGMLYLLAAMQGIPTELYEAAEVDGAPGLTRFFRITLPMITPVIFYNLVLTVIGLFQYFLVPLVLKGGTGDPGNSTLFYNLYLYKQFFTYQDMAYGATLAWVLFVIVLAVTGLLYGTQRYWVYAAEE